MFSQRTLEAILDQAEEAARAGHRVAAAVIQHQGAIVPKEAMPAE